MRECPRDGGAEMSGTNGTSRLSEKAREILRSKTFAHVAVTDERGRPHVTPVWVDLDGDRGVVNTAEGRVKDRLMPLGAPVALSATSVENPYEYVQVRGTVAERRPEGADAVIDGLAKKYLGADKYPFRQPDEVRVTIFVDVEETTGA